MREQMPGILGHDAAALSRRLRILRHRTLRWFQPPISVVVRDRSGAVRDPHRDG